MHNDNYYFGDAVFAVSAYISSIDQSEMTLDEKINKYIDERIREGLYKITYYN
jgi:hypothetical protein